MTPEVYDILKATDTPTVCNAIEIAQGSRDFRRFTKRHMVPVRTGDPPMVGRALTAKIRAKSPPKLSATEIGKIRMDYYKYVSEAGKPAIVAMQDLDSPEPHGAFWGEINATVHQAFKIEGVVTDGTARDIDALPAGFPILAGTHGVSHAFVHVLEFDTPVSIFGMDVRPGELIHADRHGALVVPEALLNKLPEAIRSLTERERIVLEPARNSERYDFETFRRSWEAFTAKRE